MEKFLSEAILYQKTVILENYSEHNTGYCTPYHFREKTFEYYCEKEGKNTTFKLWTEHAHSYEYTILPEAYFKDDYLDFTFSAVCKCQSCNEYCVHFLLNVTSDKPITDIVDASNAVNYTDRSNTYFAETNILIQKVGAFPEPRININKQVAKFFCREVNNYYYKGVKSINDNYGIGALAYFRRIIEKELKNIIEEIKELPDADKPMIQRLIDEHDKNPHLSTIYVAIFDYLPNSLKILGDNPIKLLYNQMSGGLHNLTEEESMNKAKNILALLEFVILRINEEKSVVKDMKQIVKQLKS